MSHRVNPKFKNSLKDEYDSLYEAVYGEAPEAEPFAVGEFVPYVFEDTVEECSGTEESLWGELPDIVLEEIFSHLTIRDKFYASLTCTGWCRGFYLPKSWKTFIFDDKTLTRRLFNYYSGWQYMLDHLRTQLCLRTIGQFIKTLIFKPICNFYNLYEFMNMISFYAESRTNPNCSVRNVGHHINCLRYIFPCNMSHRNETRLYGTGGKLLDALKRLMGNLPSLKRLHLIDLMLDSYEASQLLDEVCYHLCLKIKELVLINISKTQCPLIHVGVFLNLQELSISPQSLSDEVVSLLGETTLRHLRIVQNSYTTSDIQPISAKVWKQCAKNNPALSVYLILDSAKEKVLMLQDGAPVKSIIVKSPKIKLESNVIPQVTDLYSQTLTTFGHLCLPRFYQPKSFNERNDSMFIYLCNSCTSLTTLMIRERISTATIILIANMAPNLNEFKVRKNAVILRCDWPKHSTWTDQFYADIKNSSQSYEQTERMVSSSIGRKWKMLTDKEYKSISMKLY